MFAVYQDPNNGTTYRVLICIQEVTDAYAPHEFNGDFLSVESAELELQYLVKSKNLKLIREKSENEVHAYPLHFCSTCVKESRCGALPSQCGPDNGYHFWSGDCDKLNQESIEGDDIWEGSNDHDPYSKGSPEAPGGGGSGVALHLCGICHKYFSVNRVCSECIGKTTLVPFIKIQLLFPLKNQKWKRQRFFRWVFRLIH